MDLCGTINCMNFLSISNVWYWASLQRVSSMRLFLCSGHHMLFTHARCPVRSWAETCIRCFFYRKWKSNIQQRTEFILHQASFCSVVNLVPRASALIALRRPGIIQLRTWFDWSMRIQWKYRKLFINRMIFCQHGCYHKECLQKLNAGFCMKILF
jgi:hypothetical protein